MTCDQRRHDLGVQAHIIYVKYIYKLRPVYSDATQLNDAMSVCCTVPEIFSIKSWRDLEMGLGSFKVTENDAVRYTIYDFLLVCYFKQAHTALSINDALWIINAQGPRREFVSSFHDSENRFDYLSHPLCAGIMPHKFHMDGLNLRIIHILQFVGLWRTRRVQASLDPTPSRAVVQYVDQTYSRPTLNSQFFLDQSSLQRTVVTLPERK